MPKKKSNSNILKCIICCLEEKRYPHVLYWQDRSELIFTVVFVHKNNPKWNESYLALFRELDKLSPKKNYFARPEYIRECKVRCKSNLKKLCDEGILIKGEIKKYGKSIFSVNYQIKDKDGTYCQFMTGYGRNPDQFCSPCEDSGNGNSMDYNEINNSLWFQNLIILAPRSEPALRLESAGNSIHGDEWNVNGGCENLSDSGSKQLIIYTDSGNVSYPDNSSTPVGELVDISLYASNENCYEEPKVYLSNPNTAKGTSGDEEMDILYPEESYHINVTEKEKVKCIKTETSFMNDDNDENGFNFYFFFLKLLHCAKQFKIK